MSKKILIVSEYFYPEEFKINEVAIAWKNSGYDVDVLTQNPSYPYGKIFTNYENKWYSKDSYKGIPIYRVKAVTGYKNSLIKKVLKYFSFMFLGSIIAIKIGKKYDYIFGFDIAALTGMIPAVLINKIYKKQTTLWVQDIWPDSVYAYGFKKTFLLEVFLSYFVKFVYKNTSNFAITAKGFDKKIKQYLLEEKKIEYMPNWADVLNKNLEAFVFSKEEKTNFTFAGNIGKVQNLENIILSFASLPRNFIDKSQLNIIGDGSNLKELKRIVKREGYSNVIFWGRKPRSEMYKYYKSSDYLIVSLVDKPIFSLTVPAKTQTYIAAEKPIFGVIKGETEELIKEYNLGYCSEPNNINEIQDNLKKAIESKTNERLKFSENCKKLTHTFFNKEKVISSLLELLIGKKH